MQNIPFHKFDGLLEDSGDPLAAFHAALTRQRHDRHKDLSSQLALFGNKDSARIHEIIAEKLSLKLFGPIAVASADNPVPLVTLPAGIDLFLPGTKSSPLLETPLHLTTNLGEQAEGLFHLFTWISAHARTQALRQSADLLSQQAWDDLILLRHCRLQAYRAQKLFRQNLDWWPETDTAESLEEFEILHQAALQGVIGFLHHVRATAPDSADLVTDIITALSGDSSSDVIDPATTPEPADINPPSYWLIFRYLDQVPQLMEDVARTTSTDPVYQRAHQLMLHYSDLISHFDGLLRQH